MKKLPVILSALLLCTSLCAAESAPLSGGVKRDTLLGVPCRIYLPFAYDVRTQDTFPCLYLQHGMFGSEDDWTEQGNLLHWMDSLRHEDMVQEMVIVMPDNFLGSIPPDERTALMFAPNIRPDSTEFSTENGSAHWRKLTREQEQNYEMSGYWEEHFPMFLHEVEQQYRVRSDRASRAIAGLSMGGFHTMHVSHFLTDTFAYAGLFSPVILPRRAPDLNGDVPSVEDSPYHTAGFDMQVDYASPAYSHWMTEVKRWENTPMLYWIGIGRDDFLYVQLQDYRLWLETNHIQYTYYESAGGHTWQNWQDYLCRFLPLLFK